jgi:hypothetical protein
VVDHQHVSNTLDKELKMSLLSPSSDARLAVPADTTAYVAVKIRTNGVHEHVWQICKSEKLERLVERYCTRHQVAKGNVRFEFDGERMNENATAEVKNGSLDAYAHYVYRTRTCVRVI